MSHYHQSSLTGFSKVNPMFRSRSQLLILVAYYLGLAIVTGLGIVYGYYFSEIYFAAGDTASGIALLMNGLKLFWLIPLPYALLNFYAFLRYPIFLRKSHPPVKPLNGVRLYFRIVTRGKNPTLVAQTVAAAQHALRSTLPAEEWAIEVVTDGEQSLGEFIDGARVIAVPNGYVTSRKTRYKGRALHFALTQSQATDQDWLIHLDEETRFDADTVRAIHAFVADEHRAVQAGQRAFPKIGQGVILYGKRQITNWLTTLADSIRVGDDYGRFRLQFEHGRASFGMHGSFIVINSGLERQIGFDYGPESSITEDAHFALIAQAMGVKFSFIHAFMYEQSPFSIMDFIRQRRRWFGGLWLCTRGAGIALQDRLILSTFMIMWSVSWICLAMVYVNFLFPTGTPAWLAICGGVSFLYYVTLYLVGFFRTFDMRDWGIKFFGLLLLQIILIPVFSAMEAAGVLYGLLSPPKDFYIVQKEPTATQVTQLA